MRGFQATFSRSHSFPIRQQRPICFGLCVYRAHPRIRKARWRAPETQTMFLRLLAATFPRLSVFSCSSCSRVEQHSSQLIWRIPAVAPRPAARFDADF